MALQKQVKDILFVGGVNEKLDSKVVAPPLLTELINADMSRPGAVSKRFGYDVIDSSVANGRLFKWGDSIGIFDTYKAKVLSADPQIAEASVELAAYPDMGINAATSKTAVQMPVLGETVESVRPDFAENNGYRITCNGWAICVFHGDALVHSFSIEDFDAAGAPTWDVALVFRCLAVGPYLVCVYVDPVSPGTIRWKYVNTDSISAGFGTVATITDAHAASYLDAIAVNASTTHMFIAYRESAGSFARLRNVGVTTGTSAASATSTGSGSGKVALIQHSQDLRVVVVVGGAGAGLYAHSFTSATAFTATSTLTATVRTLNAPFVLAESLASNSIRVYSLRDSGTTYTYDATIGAVPLRVLDVHEQPTTGAAGSLVDSCFGVQWIFSKVLSVGESDLFAACIDPYPLHAGATACLLRVGRLIAEPHFGAIGSWLRSAAADTTDYFGVNGAHGSQFVAGEDGVYRWIVSTGRNSISDEVNLTTYLETVPTVLCGAELQEARVINSFGSTLTSAGAYIDRGSDFDLAPLPRPKILSVASAGASSYGWIVVFEWIDAKGEIHRSMPSEAVIDASATQAVVVTVASPVLRHTGTPQAWTRFQAVLYRTVAGGSTYYRVGGDTSIRTGWDGGNAVSFTITEAGASDASIEDNEILYTQTGILENECPPSGYWIEEHSGRLWCIDEDGQAWFSRERVFGEALGWNSTLTVDCSAFGVPTALVSEETSLVVFWSCKIGRIFGDGPNDGGDGGQFSAPQTLSGSHGCENRKSIVKTPVGIMFQDPRDGLCLLPPGGPVQIIGQSVTTTLAANTITAAVLIGDKREVRWYTADETVIIYHYETAMWSTHELSDGVGTLSAIEFDGRAIVANASQVERESLTVWEDSGLAYPLTLTTGWISLDGLQGFSRIWDLYVLGKWRDESTIRVKVWTDFIESSSEDFDFTAADVASKVPMMLRVRMRQQLARSIKVGVVVTDATGEGGSATGAGVDITGLRIVYGSTGRRARIPQSLQEG